MRLNLSDEPVTAELLAESLRRSGSAVIAVNGNSMYPTLQMGWRVHLEPARGDQLRIGDLTVFRGENYLTIHRLVWRESAAGGDVLVFRGDYNRSRERTAPGAVIARVVAIEIPGRRRGMERIVAVETDALTLFYRFAYRIASMLGPLIPGSLRSSPQGRLGRLARALFRGAERAFSAFLPQRR